MDPQNGFLRTLWKNTIATSKKNDIVLKLFKIIEILNHCFMMFLWLCYHNINIHKYLEGLRCLMLGHIFRRLTDLLIFYPKVLQGGCLDFIKRYLH